MTIPHADEGQNDRGCYEQHSGQIAYVGDSTSKRSLHLLGVDVRSTSHQKCFHISPFPTSVTQDKVLQYITENTGAD